MMPYQGYRNMSDEDVESLVAYLNSLPPVKNPLPETRLDFPIALMIKAAPQPAAAIAPPDRTNPVKYGEYLAGISGCVGCHTPFDQGVPVPGKTYAGGEPFHTTLGTVVSANITPDMETGLGKVERGILPQEVLRLQRVRRIGSAAARRTGGVHTHAVARVRSGGAGRPEGDLRVSADRSPRSTIRSKRTPRRRRSNSRKLRKKNCWCRRLISRCHANASLSCASPHAVYMRSPSRRTCRSPASRARPRLKNSSTAGAD